MKVYKNHTKSHKSSHGNSSKARQAVLSSSGASSNSLKSLGLNAAASNNASGATQKSAANSILISELSKYININQQQIAAT